MKQMYDDWVRKLNEELIQKDEIYKKEIERIKEENRQMMATNREWINKYRTDNQHQEYQYRLSLIKLKKDLMSGVRMMMNKPQCQETLFKMKSHVREICSDSGTEHEEDSDPAANE